MLHFHCLVYCFCHLQTTDNNEFPVMWMLSLCTSKYLTWLKMVSKDKWSRFLLLTGNGTFYGTPMAIVLWTLRDTGLDWVARQVWMGHLGTLFWVNKCIMEIIAQINRRIQLLSTKNTTKIGLKKKILEILLPMGKTSQFLRKLYFVSLHKKGISDILQYCPRKTKKKNTTLCKIRQLQYSLIANIFHEMYRKPFLRFILLNRFSFIGVDSFFLVSLWIIIKTSFPQYRP